MPLWKTVCNENTIDKWDISPLLWSFSNTQVLPCQQRQWCQCPLTYISWYKQFFIKGVWKMYQLCHYPLASNLNFLNNIQMDSKRQNLHCNLASVTKMCSSINTHCFKNNQISVWLLNIIYCLKIYNVILTIQGCQFAQYGPACLGVSISI